jgi:hypothetical protein
MQNFGIAKKSDCFIAKRRKGSESAKDSDRQKNPKRGF